MRTRMKFGTKRVGRCFPFLFSIIMLQAGCERSLVGNRDNVFVMDVDGNEYPIVRIGDQWWMAENLKTIHYRNGDEIPIVTDRKVWESLVTGATCLYSDDPNYVDVYGCLYNWFAVNDARNIAPEGWHVPTDEEWSTLIDCIGGSAVAGGRLKEAGTDHWYSPNTGATNESGFTALPAGYVNDLGTFGSKGHCAYFWTSTEHYYYYAWPRALYHHRGDVERTNCGKQNGFSVRCVKDEESL